MMIATPAGWAVRSDAESLIAPGSEGYLGVLADHAPLMSALGVGGIRFRDRDGYGIPAILRIEE